MAKAKDIDVGEEVYIGDTLATRASSEMYKECWGRNLPKGKIAFYSISTDNPGGSYNLEWYIIPSGESTS